MKFLKNIKPLLLVIVAALTLEATALVQMYFSQKGIREQKGVSRDGRNQILNQAC